MCRRWEQTISRFFIKNKTNRLQAYGQQVGLHICTKKTETMTLNVEATAHFEIRYEELNQTDHFTYLDSIITPEGGTKEGIHSRLG